MTENENPGRSAVAQWIESSPYTAALGVQLDSLGEGRARLRLPFKDENSNPGRALHGGCAATLAALGGQTVTRDTLGPESHPWHIAGLQVNYLAAAIGEDVTADARLLRRGKDMCFVEVDVATLGGKSIAHATAMVRARFGAEACDRVRTLGDDGAADPGPMGPHIGKTPFMGQRGIVVEHMQGGRSRLVMPWSEKNADADGGVHEGAVLALLDTTGAMASWGETGPGRFKASTPALQAQILGPPPKGDLVAYGRVVQRDDTIFWSDAEVASASDGAVVARGTVIYRIVP
ncbi:MAG: PaaI family thioesterase [Proteobacteria bacterium]|nr:PaaI family thioesterase [Pseudomonadota bacterium]